MATTITFNIGATIVTLPVPQPGITHVYTVPSDGIQTGGGWYGYKFGTVWDVQTLAMRGVSHTQLDALLAFYKDNAKGLAVEFTYTDGMGETHTARFLEPPRYEVKHRGSPGQYDVSVRIRTTDKVT